MIKFLVFILLISKHLFAANIVLEKHATSGLGIPENSFIKDCYVYQNGILESKTIKGDGTAISSSRKLTRRTMMTLKAFLKVTSSGNIETGPVMCDGGNNLLYGYYKNSKFIVDEEYDCGTSSTNTHPASRVLRKMAKKLCGF